MKQTIAILLSGYLFLGSLVPGNSFLELSSLPALVKHYQTHRAIETPALSVFTFLKLHYANPKHQHADSKNHGNLPFQHKENNAPMDEIANPFSLHRLTEVFNLSTDHSFLINFFLPGNPFSSGVFHPPAVYS